MAAAPDTIGFETDAWLGYLEEAGFVIGIRERLLALSLFAKLTASGALPALTAERLKLIGPLVSSSPTDQRKYSVLLTRFLEEGRAGAASSQREGEAQPLQPPPGQVRRKLGQSLRQNRWPLCVAAVLIALGAAYGPRLVRHFIHPHTPPVQPAGPTPGDSNESAAATTPGPAPIYVAPAHFRPVLASEPEPFTPPDWLPEVSAGLTAVCAVLLVLWFWRRTKRQLYLQAATVDVRDVDRHPLMDPTPVTAQLPPPLVRPVSRALRQRVAGDGQVFDLPATIAATIRNAGALAARFRPGRRTPEYVALIDRRSGADHLAGFYEGVLRTLRRHDVAVHAFHYDTSPAHGLTKYSDSAWPDDLARRPRVSFPEVAARFAGLRLLVFGECDALMNALTGEAADWARCLSAFVERAWFTPLPLPSWGLDERLADRCGFLVLPSQPGGLEALAGWLSSARATFSVRPDWPQLYPAMLRGDAVQWASRQAPLAKEDTAELLSQLRVYLGPLRFQWLCACALFPALSEPLTLALGRKLMSEPVELVFGVSILGVLPWFRYGSMPEWLRFALRERLSPENEALFRAEIESRLASAQTSSEGERLADVAVRRRGSESWLGSWLRGGSGIKSDAVLVDFLQSGKLTQLAQRLPSALRKRLFPQGLPAYGVRPSLIASVAILGIVAAGAFAWWGNRPEVDAPQMSSVGVLKAADSDHTSQVAFSPDGLMIVTTGTRTRLWTRSGKLITELQTPVKSPFTAVAFSPDGSTIALAARNRSLELWSRQGKRIVATSGMFADSLTFSPDGQTIAAVLAPNLGNLLTREGKRITSLADPARKQYLSVAFSPDGAVVAIATGDGIVRLWSRDGKRLRDLSVSKDPVASVRFSPDGQTLLTASHDDDARLSSLDGQRLTTLSGHTGPVNSAEFSPDGQSIVTASYDGTARVWTGTGETTAILAAHAGAIRYAHFSPDGKMIVTGAFSSDALRVWNRAGKLVAVDKAVDAPATSHQSERASVFSPDGSTLLTWTLGQAPTLFGGAPRSNIVFSMCAGAAAAAALQNVTRTLDSLGYRGALRNYGLIGIPVTVWPSSEVGVRPEVGEVYYSRANLPSADELNANTLVNWFTTNPAGFGVSRADWKASAASIPQDMIVVGACAGPAPAPAPVAASSLTPPQNPLTYPLTCRGAVANPVFGRASIRFQFKPGHGPFSGGLESGQCTWWDRALRPGEPTTVCDASANPNLAQYERLIKDPNAYMTVMVYNDNAGCMRVTGVRATPAVRSPEPGKLPPAATQPQHTDSTAPPPEDRAPPPKDEPPPPKDEPPPQQQNPQQAKPKPPTLQIGARERPPAATAAA